MYKRLFIISVLFLLFPCLALGSEPPKRIVALAPSVTEMLFALGVEDRVVGVTDFCDYPPRAKEKPHMGGMANPSLEAVVSARPDLVILTTDGNPKEFEVRLRKMGLRTYVMRERRIDQLPESIMKMGELVGAHERARELADYARGKYESFRRLKKDRGKALFVVWPEPLIAAGPGTAINDALLLLGFDNIAADAGTTYPKYSLEIAVRRAPDYIFIGNGMGMDMTEVARGLMGRLQSTPAARNGRIFFMGDHLFRFGLRMLEGMDEMIRLIGEDSDA